MNGFGAVTNINLNQIQNDERSGRRTAAPGINNRIMKSAVGDRLSSKIDRRNNDYQQRIEELPQPQARRLDNNLKHHPPKRP